MGNGAPCTSWVHTYPVRGRGGCNSNTALRFVLCRDGSASEPLVARGSCKAILLPGCLCFPPSEMRRGPMTLPAAPTTHFRFQRRETVIKTDPMAGRDWSIGLHGNVALSLRRWRPRDCPISRARELRHPPNISRYCRISHRQAYPAAVSWPSSTTNLPPRLMQLQVNQPNSPRPSDARSARRARSHARSSACESLATSGLPCGHHDVPLLCRLTIIVQRVRIRVRGALKVPTDHVKLV